MSLMLWVSWSCDGKPTLITLKNSLVMSSQSVVLDGLRRDTFSTFFTNLTAFIIHLHSVAISKWVFHWEFMLNMDLNMCKNVQNRWINQQLTNHSNTSTEILTLLSLLFMKVLCQFYCKLWYSDFRQCGRLETIGNNGTPQVRF